MDFTSPNNLHNCNKKYQFTFDSTESSQVLKITNKHYYRRVHKVAKEENAHSYEIVLIKWNIFKVSWINEWNRWYIHWSVKRFVSFPRTLILTEFVKYRRYKLVGEPAQNSPIASRVLRKIPVPEWRIHVVSSDSTGGVRLCYVSRTFSVILFQVMDFQTENFIIKVL